MKLAILGAGAIGSVMAQTINLLNEAGYDKVELYAVASRSLEKSQEFAQTYNVKVAYGSYEELYQDKEVDLVYVATPHNFHYEQARKCIENGIAVLLEKAFTVNAKQAQELIELAHEKNVLLTEAIWTRYQPMRKLIDEAIESRIVGEPLMIKADLSYPMSRKARLMDPNLAGGALLDVGVYPINFADMIFGSPSGVEASCVKNAAGVDVQNSITLTYENSPRMAILSSSALVSSSRQGEIMCSQGYMIVDNINNPLVLKIYNKEFELQKTIEAPLQHTGYEYEVIACVEALEKGEIEIKAAPHAKTIEIMQLCDSIRAQFNLKYPFE